MKYTVGQVIFLLLKKDKKVLPVKIVEQIVRRTLDEEVVSYNVVFPDRDRTVVGLSELNSEIFTDSTSLRKKMIERATSMIDEIVGQSERVAEEKFDYTKSADDSSLGSITTEDPVSNVLKEIVKEDMLSQDFNNAEVDLGDGLKARVSSSVL
tara:strand:+ start:1369 stop:1827 length:459 start_codon:yes stop_codon:yes gene_type:complete